MLLFASLSPWTFLSQLLLYGSCESSIQVLNTPKSQILRYFKGGRFTKIPYSLIRRISIQAISSGSLVAMIGIVFITLFCLQLTGEPLILDHLGNPTLTRSAEFLIISNIFGRIYTITVLVNIMGRRNRRGRNSSLSTRHTSESFHASGLFSTFPFRQSSRTHLMLNSSFFGS